MNEASNQRSHRYPTRKGMTVNRPSAPRSTFGISNISANLSPTCRATTWNRMTSRTNSAPTATRKYMAPAFNTCTRPCGLSPPDVLSGTEVTRHVASPIEAVDYGSSCHFPCAEVDIEGLGSCIKHYSGSDGIENEPCSYNTKGTEPHGRFAHVQPALQVRCIAALYLFQPDWSMRGDRVSTYQKSTVVSPPPGGRRK